MIRIVCKAVSLCPDGISGQEFKTFEIESPEMELWLKETAGWSNRSVVGAELVNELVKP